MAEKGYATPPGRAPIYLPGSRTNNLTKSQDLQLLKKHDVPTCTHAQPPRHDDASSSGTVYTMSFVL
ncbi:hypothetical protein E4U43_000625 [Claviceps pusilla]|uniref:Uncharacterized protein n=1 Tax=Claviceps pusilla TaxID=123648 RepID=A0A9P7N9H2_9HYPO|nr:hypothetical protein E4U43_000625 [Claviceps pusilla]